MGHGPAHNQQPGFVYGGCAVLPYTHGCPDCGWQGVRSEHGDETVTSLDTLLRLAAADGFYADNLEELSDRLAERSDVPDLCLLDGEAEGAGAGVLIYLDGWAIGMEYPFP